MEDILKHGHTYKLHLEYHYALNITEADYELLSCTLYSFVVGTCPRVTLDKRDHDADNT